MNISTFKSVAILGLFFTLLSSEESCSDPRSNEDLYGPEEEINYSWEYSVSEFNECRVNGNELTINNVVYENGWLADLVSEEVFETTSNHIDVEIEGVVYQGSGTNSWALTEVELFENTETFQKFYLLGYRDQEWRLSLRYFRLYSCEGDLVEEFNEYSDDQAESTSIISEIRSSQYTKLDLYEH